MNSCSQAQPFPEETVLLNCLNPSRSPSTIPTTGHKARGPRRQGVKPPWVLRQAAYNPAVFSKQDEGAMECTQVQILVEQLSYGKIFGPNRARI